jgi:hypothetical protein
VSEVPPLAATYLKTLLTVLEDGAWVEAHRSRLLEQGAYHVITAWNPLDTRPGEAANREADERLRIRLDFLGLTHHRAIGRDPDSEHLEEGWAVSGLDDAAASMIGTEFAQNAIFRITPTAQVVIACFDGWRVNRPLP